MVLPIETLARRIREETNDPKKAAGAIKLRNFARDLYEKGELDMDVPDNIRPEALKLLPVYRHPLFDYDPNNRSLNISGDKVNLSNYEGTLLEMFIANANITVPRGKLFDVLTGYRDSNRDLNIVDVCVGKLRRRISHGRGIATPIHTVRGMGYKLNGPEAELLKNGENPKVIIVNKTNIADTLTLEESRIAFKTDTKGATSVTLFQTDSNIYSNGSSSTEVQKPILWRDEAGQPVYKHPLFTYRPVDSVIIINGEIIELSVTENRILYILARQTDLPVERNAIKECFENLKIYHSDAANHIDVYIRRIRKKIDAGRDVNPIQTFPSVGYMLLSEGSNTFRKT